ncbi:MAG: hypothetical protein ACRDSF_00010 [Pseudonocardiaceae bacterium]
MANSELPIYMQIGNGERREVARLTLKPGTQTTEVSGDEVAKLVVNSLREVADEMEKNCGE